MFAGEGEGERGGGGNDDDDSALGWLGTSSVKGMD